MLRRLYNFIGLAATMETKHERRDREKILTILDQRRIMTIATLRPDGWPQATTVGYANEGLTQIWRGMIACR
jgi:nitroimidazol reductase NimA-like FMN-containing flavoprotein (pyridoxamine 5'-phosphate oxidase superfamily)